ncbi:hypothetical protein BJ508DRAFT_310883 [Ascobolus immersus RN42]|uniref:Uncharacterized protein n=1 Tax=Ascobolus immersus RN42 TaxID=1160509 RepID=A0A3N4I493_ASCIM|nr:hypothetical protein BJ508DRAFT_310883 [Ascobolus immersus RN42]
MQVPTLLNNLNRGEQDLQVRITEALETARPSERAAQRSFTVLGATKDMRIRYSESASVKMADSRGLEERTSTRPNSNTTVKERGLGEKLCIPRLLVRKESSTSSCGEGNEGLYDLQIEQGTIYDNVATLLARTQSTYVKKADTERERNEYKLQSKAS